ncbi:hypothetical protein C8Q73DRAFT_792166 [Cubamyces lactineus]|nr:hypothetical protein C8Q73DRAFT_792166 [Cubamyces lactineus]
MLSPADQCCGTVGTSELAAPCKGAAAWHMRPRATLLALVYFARHCLKMITLRLELDANPTHIRPSQLLKSTVSHGPDLRGTLFLGHSPIEEPYAVAAFLSGIFSRLGFIDTSWPNQRHAYYPGHEEVEDDADEAVGPDYSSSLSSSSLVYISFQPLVVFFHPYFVVNVTTVSEVVSLFHS